MTANVQAARPAQGRIADDKPVVLTRAERSARSRELILKAAIELFAERGYDGVPLDEVSARSGANRSLLLYYFKSKEELWRAAAVEVAAAFNTAVESKLESIDPGGGEDGIRARLTVWLDAFLEQPAFARFLVREGGLRGPRLDFLVQHFHYDQGLHLTGDAREKLQSTIVRDALMAIYLAMAALGPLMETSLAHASNRPVVGVHPLTDENRQVLIDTMMRVIRSVVDDRQVPASAQA